MKLTTAGHLETVILTKMPGKNVEMITFSELSTVPCLTCILDSSAYTVPLPRQMTCKNVHFIIEKLEDSYKNMVQIIEKIE